MAKHRKSRPGRSRRQLPGFWLWVVAGVVAVFLLYMLARTLSHTTAEPAPIPVLATANQDLVSLTRMLGDIEPDTASLNLLPEEVRGRLRTADSLVAQRSWPEAITDLRRCLKTVPAGCAPAVRAYLGYCYNQSASPDRSLSEFRRAFQASDSTGRELQGRAAFYMGYLFQSRGISDSAEACYAAARTLLPDSSPLRVAVLNNLGVSREKAGDTTAARTHYAAAATFCDTAADTRLARTLRDNLRRVTR